MWNKWQRQRRGLIQSRLWCNADRLSSSRTWTLIKRHFEMLEGIRIMGVRWVVRNNQWKDPQAKLWRWIQWCNFKPCIIRINGYRWTCKMLSFFMIYKGGESSCAIVDGTKWPGFTVIIWGTATTRMRSTQCGNAEHTTDGRALAGRAWLPSK